jgi:hypothetical protein
VFESTEVFYNGERLYGPAGYQSPVDFETQLVKPRSGVTPTVFIQSRQGKSGFVEQAAGFGSSFYYALSDAVGGYCCGMFSLYLLAM